MARYEETIHEPALMEYVTIRSNDPFLFSQKKEKQLEKWKREKLRLNQESLAKDLIKKAQSEQEAYGSLLDHTLNIDDKINWTLLQDHSEYQIYEYSKPQNKDSFFLNVPKENFLEKLVPFLKTRRLKIETQAKEDYRIYLENFQAQEKNDLEKHKELKNIFDENKSTFNQKIDELKIGFETGKREFIEKYISMVLERSDYPQSINLDHQIEYSKNSLSLTVKTLLPDMNVLNFISDVKYNKSKDEITKKLLPKKDSLILYKDIINQLALRTIHEIFESEYIGHIQEVTFTGVTKTLDPRTGQMTEFQILKIKVERNTFIKINLSQIDHEACIENLGSSIDKKNLDIIYKAAA